MAHIGDTGSPGTTRPGPRKPRILLSRRRMWLWVVGSLVAAGGLVALFLALRPAKCLVVAFGEAPVPLDPHLGNRAAGWSVLSSFYDPLVAMTADLRTEPALATSWQQIGATLWRLKLRPGVRFQDGSPLTALDVVASLHRALTHPDSAVRHYLSGVRSVRAENGSSVVVETDRPVPNLVSRLAFVMIIPASHAGRARITHPIGTGPYRFVDWLRDGTVLARAWPGWRGLPDCREVRFEFCGTGDAALGRFLAGKADVCHLVPDASIREVWQFPGLRIEVQPRLAVQCLSVSLDVAEGETRRALADRRVRKALLLALDRTAMVAELFHGNGVVASQYVHPAVFGYDASLSPLPYDPEGARRLLAEAGFPGGFRVALAHDAANADAAAAIARDLAVIGVRVDLSPGAKRAPLLYFSWACTTGDASDFLNSTVPAGSYPRTAGNVGFADAETEALLERADHETDRPRRLELLQEAQRRTLDLLPILPLTIRWGSKGVSSRVSVVNRFDEREYVATFRWRK